MSRSYYYQLLACWNIQVTAIHVGEGHCYNTIILCAAIIIIIDRLYKGFCEAATIVLQFGVESLRLGLHVGSVDVRHLGAAR
jgi:hypothetical protein